MCCKSCQREDADVISSDIRTFDVSHVGDLIQNTASMLSAQMSGGASVAGERPHGDDVAALSQIHLPDSADSFLVTAAASSESTGDIVLRGQIGPLPFELHLRISLEHEVITVTADLIKPFRAGPFEWKFKLNGIVRDKSGAITGAMSVAPLESTMPESVASLGLNWWCVLRCGGLALLPILVACLPSLGGGIGAYVACVTAKAGAAAAAIAKCIATKCM